ncbi:AraC family transcriptional regulator [Longispora albida]|uniref:AraC family transcriptional regulator n=1 Tax=Longispora albida TaxID=203523 RepID=UPI00035F7175|nr:AraC family transcriptional regulator [Longispora albida]
MSADLATYWRHPALPGVELLRARFVRHSFTLHAHAEYAFAAISAGVEEWTAEGRTYRAGPGALVLVNPEIPHTGHAGVPEGWRYRSIYPSVEAVTAVARELGWRGGTPWFPEAILADPAGYQLLRTASRAAEVGDDLAASSALHALLVAVLTRHAGLSSPRRAAPLAVARARELLHERIAEPPSLTELAGEVGLGPHALHRAFRAATGLPPHTYLVQERVRRARGLLAAGRRPAEVAAEVGFADQAHLTRHFRKYLGVPPGEYRRSSGL